ncbi:MAG: ATP-binding protein [Bacillota bacterium]|nr:ATP-binding protein [Bacillota bacterium]
MQRNIEADLISWKTSRRRKPLLVSGARQTGKTYSLRSFGKAHFKNVVYVNFETDQRICQVFDENISPEFLLHHLEIYFNQKIMPAETLIIFDEIQACERALTSLKYFNENAPEYPVAAAGSLLGVALKREKFSFPVGQVDQLNFYPLRLDEFFTALGESRLLQEIHSCYQERRPMDQLLHEKAMQIYRTYLVVGGMPEAVMIYAEDRHVTDATEINHAILDAYVADMAKYATPAETTRIMACFDSMPAQLAKENHKFQYKVVAKGGRASLFGEAIDWLLAAGIVTKCENVEQASHPLEVFKDLSAFKLYLCDAGLLRTKAGMTAYDIIAGQDNLFIGALTENYVANMLTQNGYPLYYWTSAGKAEIDFLIEQDGKVVPVEVKSREHVKSRSLSMFCERYCPEKSIRLSGRNFGWENGIWSVPLYAAWLI